MDPFAHGACLCLLQYLTSTTPSNHTYFLPFSSQLTWWSSLMLSASTTQFPQPRISHRMYRWAFIEVRPYRYVRWPNTQCQHIRVHRVKTLSHTHQGGTVYLSKPHPLRLEKMSGSPIMVTRSRPSAVTPTAGVIVLDIGRIYTKYVTAYSNRPGRAL